MTVAANEAGAFTWSRWAEVFSDELAEAGGDSDGNEGYWAAWLRAFETLLVAKGSAEPTEVASLAADWQEAARATPHGTPIVLKR